MSFTTYENTRNRHVTIHKDGCRQIRKRGGEHKYCQGRYESHATYRQAQAYAAATKLPVINCSFCKPV
jgi:hypothetical protein